MRDERQAPKVRGAALAALGLLQRTESAEELASASATRCCVSAPFRGMGRSADPRWTDRLMPVLGSDDPDMRREAAQALGEIEDERAVTRWSSWSTIPIPMCAWRSSKPWRTSAAKTRARRCSISARRPKTTSRAAAEKGLEDLEAAEGDPMDL